MAHGRTGPDIVMNTRYAAASEIVAVSIHEENREPDGSSAIDPDRSHLNRLLWSNGPEPVLFAGKDDRPKTQQKALEALWASGVQKPAAQAEAPYVQTVLSASPEYFRDEGQGPGEWNQEKLDDWLEATMGWLQAEYGEDLAHVSLHLDEDTPHLHVLVVPTYEKKPRRPGRQKRGESVEAFEARKAAVDTAPTVRVAGRASSEYWSKPWARRDARKSYAQAVEGLGIGYGKDFVGENEPSPEHVPTGKWVRERAATLQEKELSLDEREGKIVEREKNIEDVFLDAELKLENAKKILDEAVSLRERVIDEYNFFAAFIRDVAEKIGVSPSLSLMKEKVEELKKIDISSVKQQLIKAVFEKKRAQDISNHDPIHDPLSNTDISNHDPIHDPDLTPEETAEEPRDDGPGF